MYSPERFMTTKLPRRTPGWLVLLALLTSAHTAAHAQLAVGQITNVTPRVQVTRAGNAEFFIAAPPGMRTPVWMGDTIYTRRTGRAVVRFGNGTSADMGPLARVQIVPARSRSSLLMRIYEAVTGVFVRPRGNVEVRTAAGTAASEGTAYLIRVAEDGTTTVTVAEGTVRFFNEQDPDGVRVNEGFQSTARVGEAPTPPIAVDTTGLVQWPADVSDLPLEFEMPYNSPDPGPNKLQEWRRERQALVDANLNSAEARQNLGEVLYDLEDFAAAAREFGEALKLAPQSVAAYLGLGRAKWGQRDAPGAIAAYQQAQQLAPNDPLPRIGEALVYLEQKNYQQVSTVLAPLRDEAQAHAVLGLAALREDNNRQAIEHLKAALERDSRLYQAHSLLALAYLGESQMTQALEAARRAAASQPDSAQVQGTLAMVLFFNGDTEAAALAARRAVRLNPLSPFALLTQGRVFLSQLKTDQARVAFLQAQALAPDLAVFYNELGAVYLRLDRLPRAKQVYERAIKLKTDSALAHAGLGIVLQRQGDTQAAQEKYKEARDLAPENTFVRANLADFYIRQGQLAKALELLQGGNADSPEFGIIYVHLSEVYLYNQELFTAQEHARRAVRLLPNSAIARYQMGRVYLEQGRTVQAEQQFRQAVTLDPQFAEARYGLGFARELAESGLFSSSFLPGGATLGSSGTSLSLQNLQTPGAEERIQAALQDPTVVRVASRSYGDRQLEIARGEQNTLNLNFSHLQTTSDRRGVRGIIAELQQSDGVTEPQTGIDRENADRTFDRLGVVFGQKAKANPSGFFVLAQMERLERGQNTGPTSNEILRTIRFHYDLPRLLTGFNLQSSEGSRTRVLVQGSKPRSEQTDPELDFRSIINFPSLSAEARHDRRVGKRHLLSAGFFVGTRTVRSRDYFGDDLAENSQQKARAFGTYLRDEMKINARLSLTGELQVHRLSYSLDESDKDKTLWLPKLIIAYQPNARSGLRFRAHRLPSTPRDFQLLSPTDVFFELEGLPGTLLGRPGDEFGDGQSYELEYDYTFSNTSFVRLGVFHQRLGPATIAQTNAGNYPKVWQYGARISYEGVLNRSTTFFVKMHLNQAEEKNLAQDVAQVPDFAGEVGVQYLNRAGYFVQPLFFYSTSYPQERDKPSRDPLSRFGTLNVLAGKRWGLRATVFVELNNVFNKRYTVQGNLQFGRQVRAGVTRRF